MTINKATDRDAQSGRTLFLFHGYSQPPLYPKKSPFLFLVVLGLLCTSEVHAVGVIALQIDQKDLAAGHYRLSWHWAEAPQDVEYSLIEMTTRDQHAHGRELYAGPKLASVFNDKPDGTYRYVVQALKGNQVLATSRPLKIVVARRSLDRLWILYSVIAFAFISIISMLVVLRHKYQKAS